MIIKEFHVKNFRCILNSKNIKLDSNLTTLIGANESGKTNVLMALKSLDPKYKYKTNEICTFSNFWEKRRNNEIRDEEIEMINVLFKLDNKDKQRFKEIHPKLKGFDTLNCTKNFDNSYFLEVDNIDLELFANQKRDEENKKYISQATTLLDSFYNDHKNRLINIGSEEVLNSFKTAKDGIIYILKDDYSASMDDYLSILSSLSSGDEYTKNAFTKLNQSIKDIDQKNYQIFNNEAYFFEDLLNILPNFEYISGYEELEDSYNFEKFLEKRKDNETLDNLIKLVKLDIENLKSLKIVDRKPELSYSSKRLTELFNKYWEQDDLIFEIHAEDEITVMIKDGLVHSPQPLSIRSHGFRVALSLFINIMSFPEHSTILLDDPGVHLHPSGQKDVLKMMEDISRDRQIIFSTHSPSMVDRNNLNRVKLVFKDLKEGTKINEKFHASNYDIFEPIRAAIGLTLSDSLFATKKNLLVEGLSDLFILEAMSKFCFHNSAKFIDTSQISIFPTNGAKKMSIYIPFLIKEETNCVCILDYDSEGKSAKKELINKFAIDDNLIITLDQVNGIEDQNINIEDLIDIEFYFEALNLAYKEIFKSKIGKERLKINELPEKSFNGIKEYFKENKLNKPDKILIAKKIHEMAIEQNHLPNADTISRFATLFDMVNKKIV